MDGKKNTLFFQMLCRFLLIAISDSFTKTTFTGVEIVFRGVSRKQRGKWGKQGKERVACSQLYLLWCFLKKLNFKLFDLTGFNPVITSLNINSLPASGLDY